MDDELLWPVMYLDKNLLSAMHSLILSGSIESRTVKLTKEKSLTGKGLTNIKEDQYNEDKSTENEKKGYKTNDIQMLDRSDYTQTNEASLEDKNTVYLENSFTKTYLEFSLHNELSNELDKKNLIKYIDVDSLNEDNIEEGELIKIRGTLKSDSIIDYLKASKQLLECFGFYGIKDSEKNSSKNSDEFTINYNVVDCMLEKMIQILDPNRNKDITWVNINQDIILNCENIDVILTVNKNCFRNNSIYDKIDCPCTVFGKVLKVVRQGESISMLRQTTQAEYYEGILNICETEFSEIKNKYSIPIPKIPKLKYNGFSLIVMPISICM